MLILIINEYTKQSNNNLQHIKDLFTDEYYITKVVQFPDTAPGPNGTNFIHKCLLFAQSGDNNKYQNMPVLIIKDNNITNLNKEQIKSKIKTVLHSDIKADLYYLSVYNDQCDKYIEVSEETDGENNIVWTKNPTSTQATIYTPKGRDHILSLLNDKSDISLLINDQLIKSKLTAQAFIPNIINFDLELATSNSDYIKCNQCNPTVTTTSNEQNMMIMLWVIILIILVLLMAWAVFQLGPRYHEF